MAHSSEKETKVCTQNREKALGIHIVLTVERKFAGHQAYRISDKIWYDSMGKMQ